MNLNYEEIKKLIEGLFNKYNGLVNICVPARLEISPIRTLNNHRAGDTVYPNTVIIYSTNIINYSSSTEELITYIAETVIHELYHIDQLIDTTKINSDYAYNNSIESAVDFMTYTFITNNFNDITNTINSILGYNVIKANSILYYYTSFSKFNSTNNFYWYNRKNIYDHIIIGFINMLGPAASSMCAKLIECFETQKTVTLKINNNILPITWLDLQDDSYMIININVYNEFVYDNYFKWHHHTLNLKEIKINENDYCATFVINTVKDFNYMISE